MVWVHLLAQGPSSLTPLDSASTSIIGYVLGFGPLGLVALSLAWLLFRGYRLVPPGFESSVRDAARMDARADLIAERDRVLSALHVAEEQRDEAMTVARDQLTPLLIQFTATTQALLPILQGIVGQAGDRARRQEPRWGDG